VYNGASLRLIDASQNQSAGGSYGNFLTTACPGVRAVGQPKEQRPAFLVLPMPGPTAPPTTHLCRD
jgi:hypothetical protein